MRTFFRQVLIPAVGLGVMLVAFVVQAATDTWTGASGTNVDWSTLGNWNTTNPGGIPINGDLLLFSSAGAGSSIDDLLGLTIDGLTFDNTAGAYSFTGLSPSVVLVFGPAEQDANGNTFGGNITNNSAANQSIGLPTTLTAGNYSISTTAAGQLLFTGAITRNASATVQFAVGGGSINLNGSGLTPNNGILGGWATIGLGTNKGDWATLDGNGNVVVYSAYTTKTGGSNMGLSNSGANAANNIKITSRSSTNNTLNGTTSGTYDINTLMWNIGTSNPSGDQTINITTGQVLRFGAEGAIINDHADSRALHVGNNGGGTITAGGAANTSGELTLYSNSFSNNSQRLQINAPITDNGSGVVTVNSLGDVVLQQNSSFTGGLNVVNGRVQANTTGALGAGNVIVYPGASVFPWNSGNSGTFSNNFFLSGFGSTAHDSMALRGQNGVTLSGTITLNTTSAIGPSGTETISGSIVGPGGLMVVGAFGDGSLHLDESSANTYAGDTTINAMGEGNTGSHNVTIWIDNPSHNNIMPSGAGAGNLILEGGGSTIAQFDIGGSTQTINGLSSTGTIANTSVTSNPGGGTLVIGANNANATFGGVIGMFSSGNGTSNINITKIGSGTQTFTGNNNYNGVTTLSGGILSLGSANALAGGGVITFAPTGSFTGGTLQYSASNQVDYSGVINNSTSPISIDTNGQTVNFANGISGSNTGGLTKIGAGTLTLSGGNGYSGPTTVSAGTLSVNGSISNSSTTTINSSAVFGGTGSVGDVIVSGGTLAPGNSGNIGNFSVGNLTLNTGALQEEFSGGSADEIIASGTATFNGGGITPVILSSVTSGSYDVLTASSITGTPTLTISDIGRTHFSINHSQLANGIVEIDVSGNPAQLAWTGTDGTNPARWNDTQNDANWTRTDGGLTDPNHFYDGDSVTFDDAHNTGNQYTIAISSVVSPGSVVVNSTGAYVFNGTGSIAGSGSLTKNNTGSLSINTANTYSGGTILNNGSLNANVAGALGTGGVAINAGTLKLGNSAAMGVVTLTLNGGTLDLNGTSPTVGNFSGATGAVVTNNATSIPAAITVGTTANATYAGIIQNGTSGGTVSLIKQGTGMLTLNGLNSYSGGTTINAGTLQAGSATALGASSGSLSISATGTLDLNSNSLTVGALSGSAGSIITNTSGGTPTLTVGDATLTTTFNGVINDGVGTTALVKNGSGSLTLSGLNTFSGGTTANNGTLVIINGGSVGGIHGTLTINSGATVTASQVNAFGFAVGTKIDTVNINGGLLDSTANGDQGWGVAYVLTGGAMQTNGGVSSNTSNAKFAFGGPAGQDTSVTTLASATTSTIAGHIDLRNDNAGDNPNGPTFTVADGPAAVDLLVSAAITRHDTTANQALPGIIKDGPGLMQLTGNNTFTGVTNILNGTLSLGSANALGGNGTVTFNGGVLQYTAANTADKSSLIKNSASPISIDTNGQNVTYVTVISNTNTAGLTKLGAGTLSLALTQAAGNGYGGQTTVNGGTLAFTGTGIINGPVNVDNTGALSGSVSGPITIGSDLTFGSVATDTGSLNLFNVSATPSINVSGSINLNGAVSGVTINVGGVVPTVTGNYPIIGYGGSLNGTGPSGFALGNLPPRVTAHLDFATTPNAIDLDVTAIDFPVWSGALSSEWSTNTLAAPKNWILNSNHATTTDYLEGDNVLFDDSATSSTVDVSAANVTPSSVTFNNSMLNYTLTGSKAITGFGVLAKSGTASLTLTNANTYSGGTILSAGILAIDNASAIGTGPLTISGGTLDNTTAGAITLSTNNAQNWNGNFTFAGTANLNLGTGAVALGSSRLVTVNGGILTVGGVISDGGSNYSLAKAGAGTLVLNGGNTFTGGMTINAGVVQVNGTGGKTGLGGGNTTVNANGTLVGAASDSFGFTAGLSPAVIFINGGTVTDLGTSSYRITLPDIHFTNGGTLTSATGNNGDSNGQFSLLPGTVETDAASSTAVISAGTISLQTGNVSGTATFNVSTGTVTGGATPGVDLLVNSAIKNFSSQVGSIAKIGGGVMQLTGLNTYTGSTTVTQGTLSLGATNSIAKTSQVVLNGGMLAINGLGQDFTSPAGANGTLGLTANSSLDFGSALNPTTIAFANSAGNSWSGTLTIDNWTFGSSHLLVGSDSTGLSSSQLSEIRFADFSSGASISTGNSIAGPGEVTPLVGDINQDGHVDMNDVLALAKALTDIGNHATAGIDLNSYAHLHPSFTNSDIQFELDVNGDGLVNNADLQSLLTYLINGNGSTSTVPEPCSFLLLALGGTMLLKRKRWRSTQAD